MSWDVFVQDFPPDVASVSDIPDDFVPRSLGRRIEIIEKLLQVVPSADFADASWGTIEGDGWSIEINIGTEQDCGGFAMHARGGDGAVGVIDAILDHLGNRAIDSRSGEFFTAGPDAKKSFEEWRSFRDSSVENRN